MHSQPRFVIARRVRGGPSADQPIASPEEYCRQARRLRARFAGDATRLHEQLASLSRRRDADRIEQSPPAAAAPAPSRAADIAEEFGRRVEALMRESVDGSLLRYSHRLELLREAQRMGIGRFEANLIIALVQQRMGKPARRPRQARQRRSALATVVTAIALIQGAIFLGVWRLIRLAV